MSMTAVESLERDQGCYKYLYMFVGSTCGFMHRPIFMQKLIELSRNTATAYHNYLYTNQGKPRTIGCSGLPIMLKETTHPKSPKSMWIGSDSSNIFPEAMGRPSITTTKTGQGGCKDI